jgi:EmrB/QacA subfamily drug resistance transporter
VHLTVKNFRARKTLKNIPRSHKWWVYASVASGAFLTVADQTGTNIALPRISEDLGVDIPAAQWIYLLYTLCISALLLPMGRISDLFGRRFIYCLGLSIFSLGAFVAYVSPALSILITAKGMQGVGAAMVQANGMALMAEAFSDRQRGMAIGLYMTIIGLGAVGGPVIGGILIGAFGWRSIYLGTLILGLVSVVISMLVIRDVPSAVGEGSHNRFRTFDWVGASLSASALTFFLLAMTYSYRTGWTSWPVLLGFTIFPVLAGLFIYRELTYSDPMIELRLFKIPTFSIGIAARYLAFMAGSPAYFLLPFFLIQISGFTESRAALVLAPSSVMMALAGPLSGRLSDRMGTKWPAVGGLTCWTIGMIILATLEVGSSPYVASVGMMMMGAGNGIFGSPNTSSVMSVVGKHRFGIVSALVNMVRTSGNLTGISIGTTLVVLGMASEGFLPDLSALTDIADREVFDALSLAFTAGMRRAYMLGIVFVGSATIVTILRPGKSEISPSK